MSDDFNPLDLPGVKEWLRCSAPIGPPRAGWTRMLPRAPFTDRSLRARHDMTPRDGCWAVIYQSAVGGPWHGEVWHAGPYEQHFSTLAFRGAKEIVDRIIRDLNDPESAVAVDQLQPRGY